MSRKTSKKNRDKTLLFLGSMSVEAGKTEARLLHLRTHSKMFGKVPEFEGTFEFISFNCIDCG